MPRRQRFKPSRKPKPAVEFTESDVVIPPSKPLEQHAQPPVEDNRDEASSR
jgi:hypothetical protein